MTAYITEMQKLKYANIQFCDKFGVSEPGREIKFRVYFHP